MGAFKVERKTLNGLKGPGGLRGVDVSYLKDSLVMSKMGYRGLERIIEPPERWNHDEA